MYEHQKKLLRSHNLAKEANKQVKSPLDNSKVGYISARTMGKTVKLPKT